MSDAFIPVVITQQLNDSKEKVWNAITDHKQMIQWFFENIPSFEAVVGFNTKFTCSIRW